MTLVARAFPGAGDVFAVARRPLHETYFMLYQLREAERIDRVHAKAERIEMAVLNHYGVNSPKHLDEERRKFRESLKGRPASPLAAGPVTRAEFDFAAAAARRAAARRRAAALRGEA